MRRKPRLILVGEARDAETISAVIDAALTGHPVYTTLHSNGVADAVRRMISTFPAEERNGRALDILETLLLKERGQPMAVDAKLKFEAGVLPEREYRVIEARAKMADKDAGV